jgi:hypothetical protein
MFLPTTPQEVAQLGWDNLDVILVSGDSYIDSPFIGVAVIGKLLVNAGYRVGVIAQPDTKDITDIGRLGLPLLFWGITLHLKRSAKATIIHQAGSTTVVQTAPASFTPT